MPPDQAQEQGQQLGSAGTAAATGCRNAGWVLDSALEGPSWWSSCCSPQPLGLGLITVTFPELNSQLEPGSCFATFCWIKEPLSVHWFSPLEVLKGCYQVTF